MAVFGKLAFIHRRLWRDDGVYRAALLFGPAPLFGCLIAVAVWVGLHRLTASALSAEPAPPWAQPLGPRVWNGASGQVHAVQPTLPLPALGPDGLSAGYASGWRVSAHPILVSAALNVDVRPETRGNGFMLPGATIDMKALLAGGPSNVRFVAIGMGFLMVRHPGTYTLSARLERPAGPPANCLIRLGFGPHRVVSNLEVGVSHKFARQYDPTRFRLSAGLYRIGWAFGCWYRDTLSSTGRITLLLQPPGAATLSPIARADIVHGPD